MYVVTVTHQTASNHSHDSKQPVRLNGPLQVTMAMFAKQTFKLAIVQVTISYCATLTLQLPKVIIKLT